MLRIPIPFVAAIIVATVAVTVYLYLTVIPVPAVTDGNYTTTLVAGSPYLWRGSAGFIQFESNATISLTYFPLSYVVHLNGPPANVSITKDVRIFYFKRRGYPILYVYYGQIDKLLLFKLVNVATIGNVTVYVPREFDRYETLTYDEASEIQRYAGRYPYRAINVYTNGTHLIIDAAFADSGYYIYTYYVRLPEPTEGTSIRTAFRGIGFSYVMLDATYSGYAMPYVYFVIVPYSNARVVIYVK
jgi:hypothetical protein